MKKYIIQASVLALSAMALTGCDDFLDTMPDNRATLNNEEKITKMLVSAYPDSEYLYVAELMSDNTDDIGGPQNPYTHRWAEEIYAWKDETEKRNSSTENFWSASYGCIAAANEVLQALDKIGELSPTLKECKGEALLCRAYNHFMLANMFCQAYTKNAASHLGLPYMEACESELVPQYERGNLADFYGKIERDLTEGLKLIGDSHYSVPKYHFNVSAAYAFAARFYLYTENWGEVVKMANRVFGSDPRPMLRDWKALGSLALDHDIVSNAFVNASSNANLLLHTAVSETGLIYGGGYSGGTLACRFNHCSYTSENEDMEATNIFGGSTEFYLRPASYSASNYNKVVWFKLPYMIEYTDIVAQNGYYRTVYPAFTSEELLLNRAEAYVMLKEYDKAAADLTTWMQNMTKSTKVLTPQVVSDFYNKAKYCYSDGAGIESALKKHLNPAFEIDDEGSIQENMLQCVLGFRRLETMHFGLRWFDVKRYGIEIPRRQMNAQGRPVLKTDVLTKDDPRRAIQIPLRVRDAGLEANPR
ncbi:RagB/SusD family nutrient uptake outer membrane protein [uncultured Muribaculum sp.]|uniref:RagB/SusD family nutrient uptake outer membrane protein n=4 Tax=uncultured Muribaculum sp. TaxID=1918613 RepID=UPI00267652AD|nr:RagB/SusD family nutrient uptake outer membrane protein [uncultured Muribaculum sp.]